MQSQPSNKMESIHIKDDDDFWQHEDAAIQTFIKFQKILDIDALFNDFDQTLKQRINHQGLYYVNDNKSYEINLRGKTNIKQKFTIQLENISLGELILFQKTKLSKADLDEVTQLIKIIMYPLKNSLLYKQALDAAKQDALTKLNNRAAFDIAITQEMEMAKRHQQPLSLLILDIDKFKNVNDSYGHLAGDFILQQCARTIIDCTRNSDIVFRYGGEEFTMLLRQTKIASAQIIADRTRKTIEQLRPKYDDNIIIFTVSIGIAQLLTSESIKEFIERTDRALYEAKENGRNITFIAKY